MPAPINQKKGEVERMKNFRKLFVPLVVLCLTLGMMPLDKDGKLIESADAAKEEIPFYSVSYVKQNIIPSGTFETEGYITFVHNPYNGQMHQRLIIVHEKKTGPADTAIRIKIKDAQGLQKGGHYRFTVKAEDGKKPQQPLGLVKFTPIK